MDDGLYTHRWAAPLLGAPDFDAVCAACLSPFRAAGFNPGRKRGLCGVTLARLRYYGPAATLKFAALAAAARAWDLLFRVGLGCQLHSVRSVARAGGVEVILPRGSDVHDPDFLAGLVACKPDLLVCAFSQRAEAPFVEVPRLGCLNVHFSLLPGHRGREPMFRAMLAGRGAGVSVHWMTDQFDAGAVVCQEPVELDGARTLHQAILRACEVAARVVPEAIRRAIAWRAGKSVPAELPPEAGWPTREEIARFHRRGFRFV